MKARFHWHNVRPETITFANGFTGENALTCNIENWSFEGAFINIRLKTEKGQDMVVRLNNSGSTMELNTGKSVQVTFDARNTLLLPEGGRANA